MISLFKHRVEARDIIHLRLKAAIEILTERYLWVPSDAITFIPPVASMVYGDGRALFHFGTINLRPAFYVIRAHSGWASGLDRAAPNDAPDFVEFTDEILTDLEEEFGNARCAYQGADLYQPARERGCDCEECIEEPIAEWPMVDGQGGCHWSRVEWPAGFATTEHPWTKLGNLLVTDAITGDARGVEPDKCVAKEATADER